MRASARARSPLSPSSEVAPLLEGDDVDTTGRGVRSFVRTDGRTDRPRRLRQALWPDRPSAARSPLNSPPSSVRSFVRFPATAAAVFLSFAGAEAEAASYVVELKRVSGLREREGELESADAADADAGAASEGGSE